MTLKKKLVLLLLSSAAVLVLLLLSAFLFTIRPSLENQKVIFIDKLQKRMQVALSVEEQYIAIQCANWADDESMSNYVEHPSREFEADVFPDLIFMENIIDFIMVIHVERDILFYRAYKDERFIDFEEIAVRTEINKIKDIIKQRRGVVSTKLKTDPGPLMIVANPITSSDGTSRLRGILVLGRFIDRGMMKKLSDNAMEEIQALPLSREQLIDFYNRDMKQANVSFVEEKDRLKVYYMLRDMNFQPAMVLYTHSDNKLFMTVNQHVTSFIIITILTIIVFGLLLYRSIGKYIVKRMISISETMTKIQGLKHLSHRIKKDSQKDEITHLVKNINSMLDKLQNESIQRQKAEKAIITQEKLVSIGRLASCIGHEVNNPILAISNSIAVIKKISRSKSELFRDAIDITETEIERIRNITSSLLDFHRLDTEEFSKLDVKDIILKAVNVLEWSKKLANIRLLPEFDKDCTVYGLPGRLKQVFINFISNAVEAMEDKHDATLRIHVKNSGDCECVEVHFYDNGPGVPQQVRNYLFEPFVSTKEAKGVGLGLYISYKIVDNHHGKIIYDESYPGGTHFIIKLPKNKRCNHDDQEKTLHIDCR